MRLALLIASAWVLVDVAVLLTWTLAVETGRVVARLRERASGGAAAAEARDSLPDAPARSHSIVSWDWPRFPRRLELDGDALVRDLLERR